MGVDALRLLLAFVAVATGFGLVAGVLFLAALRAERDEEHRRPRPLVFVRRTPPRARPELERRLDLH